MALADSGAGAGTASVAEVEIGAAMGVVSDVPLSVAEAVVTPSVVMAASAGAAGEEETAGDAVAESAVTIGASDVEAAVASGSDVGATCWDSAGT